MKILKRKSAIITLIIFLFVACNGFKKPKQNTQDTLVIPAKKETNKPLTDREKLIIELTKLKLALETKNKNELAHFFHFPVPDSTILIEPFNDDFDKEWRESGGKLTGKMFKQDFVRLYDYWDLPEFANLFKHLNLSNLNKKAKLNNVYHIKGEGCYYIYQILLKGNEVIISYGTNSSDEYRKQHPDEEEVCDEYIYTWIFKWNGNRLIFKQQQVAG